MRIASVADVHLGNHRRFGGRIEASLNERARLALGVLSAAAAKAREEKARVFVVAGDLLDYVRPEPQLLAWAQGVFRALKEAGIEVVLLVGNHDQVSTARGDHALGPFAPVARVVDEPWVLSYSKCDVYAVPFRPGDAKVWLPDVLRGMVAGDKAGRVSAHAGSASRLLVLHLGIKDENTPPWLQNAPDAIHIETLIPLMEELGFSHCVAGNWHTHREWHGHPAHQPRVHVTQIGALVPTGFDNPGLDDYGGLAVFDAEACTMQWHEIPGPRFIKTGSVKMAKAETATARKRGHKLFLSLSAPHEDLTEYNLWAQRETGNGDIAAAEVLPDQQYAKEEARIAADAARSTTTLKDALHRFVGNMPMADTVNRGNVLSRCARYLGL